MSTSNGPEMEAELSADVADSQPDAGTPRREWGSRPSAERSQQSRRQRVRAPEWLENIGSYFRSPNWTPPIQSLSFADGAGLVVAIMCGLIVLLTMHPDLIFSNTVTTGGDMGAHVVAPDFLKSDLLPNFKLNGWSDAWYAGYPIYQFYMVVPAVLIVLVDIGPPLWLGVLLLAAVVGLGTYALGSVKRGFTKGLIVSGMILGALLCIDVPENVAFKLVTVLGPVCLPISVWVFAHMARAPKLMQALVPLGALYFVFDSHFEILGGNGASTLAGEFSFALSLNLVVLALGFAIRGLETGKYRATTAVLIGLAATTHVIPIFFLAVGLVAALCLRPGLRQLAWLGSVSAVGGLLSAFWLGAFYLHSDYLNDMGWEKTSTYAKILFPSTLPYKEVLIGLAVLGAIASMLVPNRFGLVLVGSLGGSALLVRFVQQPPLQRFWNERVLPFWFLALALLAAVGLSAAINAVASMISAGGDSRRRSANVVSVGMAAAYAFVIFGFTSTGWWAPLIVLAAILTSGTWLLMNDAGPSVDPGNLFRIMVGAIAVGAVVLAVVLPTQSIRLTQNVTDKNGVAVTNSDGSVQTTDWIGKSVQVPAPTYSKDASTTMLSGYAVGPFVVTSRKNVIADWSQWNYSGYEGKDKYPEFEQLMTTMGEIGRTRGCGRAMWEYFEGLGRYGTPMAPMLLPMYTKGCIGSMEGLFFEASMTTPFHFLNQSLLSARPSSPKRDMPYESLNVEKGVKDLQLYGVKYYMAKSEEAQAQAAQVADLTEIARVPSSVKTRSDGSDGADKELATDWVIYEVRNADLVTGLDHMPAVMTDVGQSHAEWLDPSVAWYQDQASWSTMLAADGPSNWPRVKCHPDKAPAEVGAGEGQRKYGLACAETPKSVPTRVAKVTNLDYKDSNLSFDVDEPGTPVLVKVSYFPRWKVDGAKGPYRVAPNLMVVVPTQRHVELYYGNTSIEYLTWFMTLVGLLGLVWFGITSDWNFGRTWQFSGDASPPDPRSTTLADPDATGPAAGYWQPMGDGGPPEPESRADQTDPELVVPNLDGSDDVSVAGESLESSGPDHSGDAAGGVVHPTDSVDQAGVTTGPPQSEDFRAEESVHDEPVPEDYTLEWQPSVESASVAETVESIADDHGGHFENIPSGSDTSTSTDPDPALSDTDNPKSPADLVGDALSVDDSASDMRLGGLFDRRHRDSD